MLFVKSLFLGTWTKITNLKRYDYFSWGFVDKTVIFWMCLSKQQRKN